MEKPGTYGQVTGAFEIFELLFIANQPGSHEVKKRVQNALFRIF